MRSLELFCGHATISEMLKLAGFSVTAIDNRKRHGVIKPTLCCDVYDIPKTLISPGLYDVVWVSPPCTAFSIAAGNTYFEKGIFKSGALPYLALLDYSIDLLKLLAPRLWFIENPRGRIVECASYRSLMREHGVYLHLLTYSSYGNYPTKPTYLLTNSTFVPRALASFGRGAKNDSGFANMSHSQRSSIPMELAADIAVYCKNELSVNVNRPLAC